MTEYCDVKAAATFVGLSKSSMDKLRLFGGGPRFYKLGRRVVYKHDDLRDWVEARAHSNTSEYVSVGA